VPRETVSRETAPRGIPSGGTPSGGRAILDLQRLAGNAAVQHLVRSVQRFPQDLATSPATDRLGRQLEAGEEDGAIQSFGALDAAETDTVLRNPRWQEAGTSAFGNATMHSAMMATGQRGLLFSKLLWEFDEGTNWEQLRALIGQAPLPQRRQVITEPWFRDQFTSECGNETMGEAVRLLGPPLRNQLDWMIDEGVDETQFNRLIEQTTPAEMYDASRDAGLMSRLREEVGGGSRVAAALESASRVAPTGETPVGPRWTQDDARMLSAATAQVGVITPMMASRVPGAVSALSDADHTAFRGLLGAAGSDTERVFICKAVASGHRVTELYEFTLLIRGMSDAWLIQNLNVVSVTSTADSGGGSGIIQQFGNSCGPTSVQVITAEADPVYALDLNTSGAIGTAPGQAASNPGSIGNALAASGQGSILTSHAAGGGGGAPEDRQRPVGTQTRGGAWVEADMNARRQATGVEYTRKNVPDEISMDELLAILTVNLGMGIHVPLIVGSGPGNYAHYVVAVRKDGTDRYQVHDVWTGETVWRTAQQFRLGRLALPSGHVAVSAVAEPHMAQ
jgi:hypothetical protein